MSYQPNAEMAVLAWVKSLPGVDATKVATTLPGDPTKWSDTGFIVVTGVGGSPLADVKLRRPVVSIACWGNTPNSDKAPWGRTQALAETVFNGFYSTATFPFRATWDQFLPAIVLTGQPTTEPRKVPGSTSGFAQVQFDATFSWLTAAGTLNGSSERSTR